GSCPRRRPCERRRVAIIPLGPRLPAGSSNLPGGFSGASLEGPPIWSCSVWGFPCPGCHHPGGALLPHHFTLACTGCPAHRRCIFCGTFPEVTLAGRWPAHCPLESGLSSPAERRRGDRPAHSAERPVYHRG